MGRGFLIEPLNYRSHRVQPALRRRDTRDLGHELGDGSRSHGPTPARSSSVTENGGRRSGCFVTDSQRRGARGTDLLFSLETMRANGRWVARGRACRGSRSARQRKSSAETRRGAARRSKPASRPLANPACGAHPPRVYLSRQTLTRIPKQRIGPWSAGQANWKRRWRSSHQGIFRSGSLAVRMIGL